MKNPAFFIFSLLEEHFQDALEPPTYQPFDDRVVYTIMAVAFIVAVLFYVVRI
jgi:hypothetical protein